MIGTALWFASRGEGILYSEEKSEENSVYRSPVRILLNGLGADEQLAGDVGFKDYLFSRICET